MNIKITQNVPNYHATNYADDNNFVKLLEHVDNRVVQ